MSNDNSLHYTFQQIFICQMTTLHNTFQQIFIICQKTTLHYTFQTFKFTFVLSSAIQSTQSPIALKSLKNGYIQRGHTW